MTDFRPCRMSSVEFLRTNFFTITVPDVCQESAIQTTTVPAWVIDPIEVGHGNIKAKFAGQVNVEDWQITLLDALEQSSEATKWVTWYEKIYKWAGNGFLASTAANYKKQGTLMEYTPTGTIEHVWILKGIWPNNIAWGELTYEDGDKKVLTVTLSIDCVEHTGGGGGQWV